MTHPYERMDCGHFASYEICSEERSSCAMCEIAKLKTENAMLREALRPFADYGAMYYRYGVDDRSIFALEADERRITNHPDSPTVGDLRSAYLSLAGEEK